MSELRPRPLHNPGSYLLFLLEIAEGVSSSAPRYDLRDTTEARTRSEFHQAARGRRAANPSTVEQGSRRRIRARQASNAIRPEIICRETVHHRHVPRIAREVACLEGQGPGSARAATRCAGAAPGSSPREAFVCAQETSEGPPAHSVSSSSPGHARLRLRSVALAVPAGGHVLGRALVPVGASQILGKTSTWATLRISLVGSIVSKSAWWQWGWALLERSAMLRPFCSTGKDSP